MGVPTQVSASGSTLCKSVGVSLRRFEPCTCHRDLARRKVAPDLRKRGSGAIFVSAVSVRSCPADYGDLRVSLSKACPS
jgi:hypothetical protein